MTTPSFQRYVSLCEQVMLAKRGQVRPGVKGLPKIPLMPYWLPIISVSGLSDAATDSFEDSISLGSDFYLCALMLSITTNAVPPLPVQPGQVTVQIFETVGSVSDQQTQAFQQKPILDVLMAGEFTGDQQAGIVRTALLEMSPSILLQTAPYNEVLRPYFTMFSTYPAGVVGYPFNATGAMRPFYLETALKLPADAALQARATWQPSSTFQILGALQIVLMGYIPE